MDPTLSVAIMFYDLSPYVVVISASYHSYLETL